MTALSTAARLVVAAGALALGAAGVVVAALAPGCGEGCRAIPVKAVPLTCATAGDFTGEIHFDDSATFESFLSTDCLPDSTADDRAPLLHDVDFTKDAVFVAVGAREQPGGARCIAVRNQDEVDVCDDGLRVAFVDKVTDENPCAGKWTVAFTLPRAELRAALKTPVGR